MWKSRRGRPDPLRRLAPRAISMQIVMVACVLGLTGLSVLRARPQASRTTAERLEEARWWPTKPNLPPADYIGAAACARCHEKKAESQARTAMARTAARAAESNVLSSRSVLTFKADNYLHEIRTQPGTSVYSVSDGQSTASAVLEWAFGAGRVGQTFIFERDGRMYEARGSYFGTLDSLDHTPGRALDRPANLEAALGRALSPAETRRCFGCHTTVFSARAGSSPPWLVPGVRCEACHGPGRAHAEAMQQDREEEGLAAIVNPAPFSPIDSVDFCGACHATYWDVTLAGQQGIAALRSQPFRLHSSRCWGEGDRRLTCVACHDPHEPLRRDAGSYDARCLSCHRSAGPRPSSDHPAGALAKGQPAHAPACSARAREGCATCHMPRYTVPEMHTSFTDHLIRIVRPAH